MEPPGLAGSEWMGGSERRYSNVCSPSQVVVAWPYTLFMRGSRWDFAVSSGAAMSRKHWRKEYGSRVPRTKDDDRGWMDGKRPQPCRDSADAPSPAVQGWPSRCSLARTGPVLY